MCAINPKHQKHFTISVYTSQNIPEWEFNGMVTDELIDIEIRLNKDAKLRWHVKEKADGSE